MVEIFAQRTNCYIHDLHVRQFILKGGGDSYRNLPALLSEAYWRLLIPALIWHGE